MSWKNIKSFLILLFLLINIYLILSSDGFVFKKQNTTYVDKTTVQNTVNVISLNYNVKLDINKIPSSVDNLMNTDTTNILYTDKFKNSRYDFKINGAVFEAIIKTGTYSYNETNAKAQFADVLKNIGINENNYTLDIYKSDEGLVCIANEVLGHYPIFNGQIKANFIPSAIKLTGSWYLPQSTDTKKLTSTYKMTDITSVIIDAAEKIAKSDGTESKITDIKFGYFVSSYDENAVSKSSSAIPCYMLKSDGGLKYYYDAASGKPIKQEE